MDFIELVSAHARRCRLTPAELFKRAGVAFSNWSRWRNRVTRPSTRVLEKIWAVEP